MGNRRERFRTNVWQTRRNGEQQLSSNEARYGRDAPKTEVTAFGLCVEDSGLIITLGVGCTRTFIVRLGHSRLHLRFRRAAAKVNIPSHARCRTPTVKTTAVYRPYIAIKHTLKCDKQHASITQNRKQNKIMRRQRSQQNNHSSPVKRQFELQSKPRNQTRFARRIYEEPAVSHT